MTSEEKEKLYQAIGYHEDGIDLQLPEEYVALTAHFNLKLLEVCVRNEVTHSSKSKLNQDDETDKMQTILSLQVSGVSCEVDQRPAASGLKLDLNMKEFTVFGCKQQDVVPVVVKSMLGQTTDNSLLDIKFEMNPLDKVRLLVSPQRLFGVSINFSSIFFTPGMRSTCWYQCSATASRLRRRNNYPIVASVQNAQGCEPLRVWQIE